jgi:nucleoside-diphosphate-sugar epimerase
MTRGRPVAGADVVVADALDRTAVLDAVAAARPDVVMHQLTDLSGGTSATNAALRERGTRNLVDAALAAGVRRVVAQSIAWAYAPGAEPAGEQEPLDAEAPEPRQTTIRGVAALESAVAEALEWVVLRYGLLYGPGTWYAPDGLRADQARAGKLTADADVSSFVHADDAAAAALAALDWPSGAVNVCDDDPAPGSDWVPAFCAAVGAPPPPAAGGERAGWARGAANRHARADLGWMPRHPTWRRGFA